MTLIIRRLPNSSINIDWLSQESSQFVPIDNLLLITIQYFDYGRSTKHKTHIALGTGALAPETEKKMILFQFREKNQLITIFLLISVSVDHFLISQHLIKLSVENKKFGQRFPGKTTTVARVLKWKSGNDWISPLSLQHPGYRNRRWKPHFHKKRLKICVKTHFISDNQLPVVNCGFSND